MVHSLFLLLMWGVVVASAAFAGASLWRGLRLPRLPWLDQVAFGSGLGLLLLIYGTALLGVLGRLSSTTAAGLLGIVALAGLPALWGLRRGLSVAGPGAQNEQVGLSLSVRSRRGVVFALAAFGVVYLISTMAPPLDGDTLHSYLDVPAQYVRAGCIVPLPYEPLSHLPLNVQMLSTLALLLAGDELAQMLVGFGMVLGTTFVIYLMGRRYLSPDAGLLGALFFATMPVVQVLVPGTKVNLGWAFFELLSLYALSRWGMEVPQDDRWLLAAGLFGGAALGSSYSAIFSVAITVLFMLIVTRSRLLTGGTLKRLALYLGPVVLLSAGWLLKNYAEVGNPVFPVLDKFFAGRVRFEAEGNHASGWLGLLKIFYDMSVGYIARGYGKPIGPIFLALLPGLAWARPLNRQVKWGLGYVVLFFGLWYLGIQRARNFLPPLAVLSLICAFLWFRLAWLGRGWRWSFAGLLVLYLTFGWVMYARLHLVNLDKLRYVVGLKTRQVYLEHNLGQGVTPPNAAMVEYINTQLPDGARIVSMYLGTGYYVERTFIDSRYVDALTSGERPTTPQRILDLWQQAGITHLFVNDLYISPVSGPADYVAVRSPDFVACCLTEVFVSGEQHLYAVRYDGS